MSANSTRVNQIRVILYPRNFELVKRFYAEVLQWELSMDSPNVVMFETGAGTLELLSLEYAKNGYQPVQGCSLSLRVDDVWGLWEELKDEVSIIYALRHNSWGDDSFCIADPEGFELTFFTSSALAPRAEQAD